MPNTTMSCRRCEATTRAPRRGLCTGCYWHVRTYGDLADYPAMRNVIDLADVAELRSRGNTIRQIADRLGVTKHAVYAALARGRNAGERR